MFTLRKKTPIFLTLLLLWCGSSIVFGSDINNTQTLHDTAAFFSMIVDILYTLLRPLLVVSGWALDNTLVLGEVFHLDTALLQFWNITRNLANFALGFAVLFMIGKHLRSGGEADTKSIVKSIGKALLAGVGIQFSFMLFKILLDISTILIYSVGAMPLRAIADTDHTHRIIQPVITINNVGLNHQDQSDTFKKENQKFQVVTYKCSDMPQPQTYTPLKTDKEPEPKPQPRTFQSCRVHNDYIIAKRPDLFYGDGRKEKILTDPVNYEYCVHYQKIFKVADIYDSSGKAKDKPTFNYIPTRENLKGTPSSFTGYKISGGAFNTSFTKESGRNQWNDEKDYQEQIKKLIKTEEYCNTTLKNLTDKAQGMTGPLTTIFSSILRFGDITLFSNDHIGRIAVSFFIRAILGIMLIAPLIVLAISLIKRVGYLRVAMVGSPFIILLKTFEQDFNIDLGEKMEIFKLEKVVGLIFMPVITIFALSIGVIFLSSIEQTINQDSFSKNSEVFKTMGIQERESNGGNVSCYTIFMVDICYETDGQQGDGRGNFLNYFSWTIMMLFATGIMRLIVFASFQASSISSKLGENIKNIGEKIALSTPIIPIGSGGMGLGSLGVGRNGENAYLKAIDAHYDSKIRKQSADILGTKKDLQKNTKKNISQSTKTTNNTENITNYLTQGLQTGTGAPSAAEQFTNKLNTSKDSAVVKDILEEIQQSTDKSKIITHNDVTYTITHTNDTFAVNKTTPQTP